MEFSIEVLWYAIAGSCILPLASLKKPPLDIDFHFSGEAYIIGTGVLPSWPATVGWITLSK